MTPANKFSENASIPAQINNNLVEANWPLTTSLLKQYPESHIHVVRQWHKNSNRTCFPNIPTRNTNQIKPFKSRKAGKRFPQFPWFMQSIPADGKSVCTSYTYCNRNSFRNAVGTAKISPTISLITSNIYMRKMKMSSFLVKIFPYQRSIYMLMAAKQSCVSIYQFSWR